MASFGCAHRVVIIVYMADRPALAKNCWELRGSWERVLQSTGHQRKTLRRAGRALRRGPNFPPANSFPSETAGSMPHCPGASLGRPKCETETGVLMCVCLSVCPSVPGPREGRRRKRTKFNKNQRKLLIEAFENDRYPDITVREELAKRTQIPEPRIQVKYKSVLLDRRERRGEEPAGTESLFKQA